MPKYVVHKVLPYFFGAVICVLLVLYPAHLLGYLDPIPYQSVIVRSVESSGNSVEIRADFVKRRCEFKRMVVVGTGLAGTSRPLPYTDIDEREGDDINRMAGAQTLRLSVNVGGRGFDELQIKTRHACGEKKDADGRIVEQGTIVDKVFATIPLTGKG